MSAPATPAAEKAERRPEARLAVDPTHPAPVPDSRSLGVRAHPIGVQRSPLDPARVTSLQGTAGNGAVSERLQRSPDDPKPAPPPRKGRPRGKKVDEEPTQIPSTLEAAVGLMPFLMRNIGLVVDRQAERMAEKGFKPVYRRRHGDLRPDLLSRRGVLLQREWRALRRRVQLRHGDGSGQAG